MKYKYHEGFFMQKCLNCNNTTKFLKKEKRQSKFCCHSCYLSYRSKNVKPQKEKISNTCIKCSKQLTSRKKKSKVCSNCKNKTKDPEEKTCALCNSIFLDKSRSKNAKYCSRRCNIKAGCIRYSLKVKNGYYPTPPKRNRKIYRKQLYRNNINFKLSIVLRTRLNCAIKSNHKNSSAIILLGCSISYFKAYLESKFLPGMTWENWTIDGWHIDHIKPLSSFDLTNEDELKQACHYTNLQPLWAKSNLTKSNKVIF